MDQGFYNRHDWWTLTAALAVWLAHFTLLWIASSIFPAQTVARWLAMALTLAASGALGWLWLRAGRPPVFRVPGLGLAIATVGTVFNAMPPLIG